MSLPINIIVNNVNDREGVSSMKVRTRSSSATMKTTVNDDKDEGGIVISDEDEGCHQR